MSLQGYAWKYPSGEYLAKGSLWTIKKRTTYAFECADIFPDIPTAERCKPEEKFPLELYEVHLSLIKVQNREL